MQALGVLMGLVMAGSLFLEWEMAKTGSLILKVNHFLGVQHNAFFSIRTFHLDFLPVVLALLVIFAMALAKVKAWRMVGLVAALLGLAIAARDIRYVMRVKDAMIGPGLWIFAAASVVAVVVAIILLGNKKSPRPAVPPPAAM